MKVVSVLICLLSAWTGAHAAQSFDLVHGSPVSVSVEFDRTQQLSLFSLSPLIVTASNRGGGRGRGRHLLAPTQSANMTSMPGVSAILDAIAGSNSSSSSAGRHLLQPAAPTTFSVPISMKKSALGGFVSAAFDLSGTDATSNLKLFSEFDFATGGFREVLGNAQIVIYTDISSPTSDIVDIISPAFFLDSSGKGRLAKFGFGADVSTFQTFTAVNNGATSGAEIFLALEVQFRDPFGTIQVIPVLIPATDFKVEKASLPTAEGILDTLC